MKKERQTSTFLKAHWADLVFLTFPVSNSLLEAYIPPGLDLDHFEGSALVSLVAFQFLNARIMGIKPPLYHSFAELNLRFYVKDPHSGNQGVVFIAEICPYASVGWMAQLLYRECFTILPSRFGRTDQKINYTFGNPSGLDSGTITAQAGNVYKTKPNSIERFIVERYHGFSSWSDNTHLHYRVSHPSWTVFNANLCEFDLDLVGYYGQEMAHVLKKPISCLYSPGSEISLSWGRKKVVPSLVENLECGLSSPTL